MIQNEPQAHLSEFPSSPRLQCANSSSFCKISAALEQMYLHCISPTLLFFLSRWTDQNFLFQCYQKPHLCKNSQISSTFGEGSGTPLQYSCLDGGAWWAAVHGIAKSQTRLNDFTFTFHSHALEREMATHSGVLAWRIPGTEESGRPPSLGSHRVGHD